LSLKYKVAGVAKASVNLATERANIEYDADKVKTDDLIKIVDDLGYKAERIENISKDREKEQREKEIKKLKAELIASAILSSPLILAMVFMLTGIDVPFLHNEYFQLVILLLDLGSTGMLTMPLIAMGTSAAYFFSVYNAFFAHPVEMGMMKEF